MLDCAQVMGHFPIDVKKLDIDFLVFSAHKFYGPTGVGVMWGREDLLKEMPPVFGGGDMIINVTFEHTDYNTLPYKFEAGTPPIAEVIGMGASIDYLLQLGYEQIRLHEDDLFKYANDKLSQIEGLTIIGWC